MILNEEFPPDHRVEKEAASLSEAGHQIILLCYTTDGNVPLKESYKGIDIRRIRFNRTLRNKLNALYLVLPFFRWVWRYHIEKILIRHSIDALHIHDLPLSDVGVKLRRKYGIKLICDQHEYYSNWIVQNAHLNTLIGKIVKFLSNWKRYERRYLQQADLVITIEEPLREAYINQVGIRPERLIKVPNTPPQKFAAIPVDQKIVDHYQQNFVLFYLGNIDVLRGMDIAVEALPLLIDQIPEIRLVMAGRTWKGSNPLEKAKALKVDPYIDFVGWLGVEDIPSYIQASDVCFHIPPVLREENDRTVATKIYQYLMIGKPVIVAQQKMEKELIDRHQVGLAIRENDPEDFARKVLQLYRDDNLRNQYARNARQISKDLVWEGTIIPLIRAYDGMESAYGQ